MKIDEYEQLSPRSLVSLRPVWDRREVQLPESSRRACRRRASSRRKRPPARESSVVRLAPLRSTTKNISYADTALVQVGWEDCLVEAMWQDYSGLR